MSGEYDGSIVHGLSLPLGPGGPEFGRELRTRHVSRPPWNLTELVLAESEQAKALSAPVCQVNPQKREKSRTRFNIN